MLYSGYQPPYWQGQTYLGYAYSSNGKTWTKYGKVSTFYAEDPYLIKIGSTYWVYYENSPNTAIYRASSFDCTSFTEDPAHKKRKGILMKVFLAIPSRSIIMELLI